MIADFGVEELAFGKGGAHGVIRLFRHFQIAIAPAGCEHDLELALARQVTKVADHRRGHAEPRKATFSPTPRCQLRSEGTGGPDGQIDPAPAPHRRPRDARVQAWRTEKRAGR